uniref:ATP synthase F0 subunit 6 n=1 Tax=Pinctada fucata TaxID=50426 RepID=G9MBK2_PINFU|nr:ATP synthase F0 subunit 6 [Pinctada fucata]
MFKNSVKSCVEFLWFKLNSSFTGSEVKPLLPSGDVPLVSLGLGLAVVAWGVFWWNLMSSDYWLGAALKIGFLSMGSLLVGGLNKASSWGGVGGVLSRLLGTHLCLLSLGLSGLLPYSFQLLVHLPSLSCVLGSVWLSIMVGFVLLRGSVVCVKMVVSTPLVLGSVVMVLVELVSTLLLILVMPVRMGGNMMVGSVFFNLGSFIKGNYLTF